MEVKKKSLEEAQQELRKEAWDLWIQHPSTQQFIRNLEKHKLSFLAKMEANVSNPAMPDASFRQWTSNAKTISTIILACRDYTLFNKLATTE